MVCGAASAGGAAGSAGQRKRRVRAIWLTCCAWASVGLRKSTSMRGMIDVEPRGVASSWAIQIRGLALVCSNSRGLPWAPTNDSLCCVGAVAIRLRLDCLMCLQGCNMTRLVSSPCNCPAPRCTGRLLHACARTFTPRKMPAFAAVLAFALMALFTLPVQGYDFFILVRCVRVKQCSARPDVARRADADAASLRA